MNTEEKDSKKVDLETSVMPDRDIAVKCEDDIEMTPTEPPKPAKPKIQKKKIDLKTKNVGPGPAGWKSTFLYGAEDNTFTAKIGPTGGKQGYEAITGRPSWGIAWYINDVLIPEVYVERDTTYKFIINGGNDPVNSAKNHPFYLTTSQDGGYIQLDADKRKDETVFAGVEGGNATAAGSLCQ